MSGVPCPHACTYIYAHMHTHTSTHTTRDRPLCDCCSMTLLEVDIDPSESGKILALSSTPSTTSRQLIDAIEESPQAGGSPTVKESAPLSPLLVFAQRLSLHAIRYPHRIASHRIASHRIASHCIASHHIASHRGPETTLSITYPLPLP